MVSDDHSNRLSIFDATLDSITASLDAGPGMALGDCVVARDERLGVTSGSSAEITFIDLDPESMGEVLPSSRLEISNLGVDMALSPDDRYLVLAGGGALHQPLSVVDTDQRAEVATAHWFADHTSVEFCDDGTLLVTTINGAGFNSLPDNAMYDARISDDGQLSLLGRRISSGAQPNNTACAPGSLAGVLLDRSGGVTSFTLPDMLPVAHVDAGPEPALAAAFSADGRRLFVRTQTAIQNFEFNPVTGDLALRWRQPAPAIPAFFGMELIALHPEGNKLYVDGGDAMLIVDADTGQFTDAIQLGDATGICLAAPTREPAPGMLAQQEVP
ncbi:MAG: hypothetical protein HKN58_03880 [Xanthomonadales bacterium]|nr:hypothetical protein [Xanthomonadales bacterium]